jgi:hypothetical protein
MRMTMWPQGRAGHPRWIGHARCRAPVATRPRPAAAWPGPCMRARACAPLVPSPSLTALVTPPSCPCLRCPRRHPLTTFTHTVSLSTPLTQCLSMDINIQATRYTCNGKQAKVAIEHRHGATKNRAPRPRIPSRRPRRRRGRRGDRGGRRGAGTSEDEDDDGGVPARRPGGAAAGDGARGGGEARVRGGGAERVPVRAVPRAAALLRAQQRGGRGPARHPRRRRRALPAPRRPGAGAARGRRALHLRLDDAAGLPAPQLAPALLAVPVPYFSSGLGCSCITIVIHSARKMMIGLDLSIQFLITTYSWDGSGASKDCHLRRQPAGWQRADDTPRRTSPWITCPGRVLGPAQLFCFCFVNSIILFMRFCLR